MYKNIKLVITVLLFTFIFILAGCGDGASNSDTATSADSGYSSGNLEIGFTDAPANQELDDTATIATSNTSLQQKLIYKGDLSIETKHFTDTVDVLLRSLEQASGYIVSQEDTNNQHSQYTTLVIKIPSARFFSWVEGIEQLPDIQVTKHIFTEDVSEEYVDLVARLEAKQVVIDKYLEYMQLATTADELIRFTNELAALQEEVEAVQARIRYLDHQVNYSTLTIYVREKTEASFLAELNMGSTLKHSFQSGVTGFVGVLGFFISATIVLLPFVIIGLLIWFIIYKLTMKRKVNRNLAAVLPPQGNLAENIPYQPSSSTALDEQSEPNSDDPHLNNSNDK